MHRLLRLGLTVAAASGAAAESLFSVAPGGPSGLDPATIFSPGPVAVAGGAGMGLVPGDVLGGFTQRHSEFQFLLCFSVDPATAGDPNSFPPPLSIFNVYDQALKNQHPGDANITTEAFDRFGIIPPTPAPTPHPGAPPEMPGPSMGANSNVLVINQSPAPIAGLPGFGLLPAIEPTDPDPGGGLDDVNGGGGLVGGVVPSLYFVLAAGSPSLPGLSAPLPPSGAHIFFDPTPAGPGGDEALFAAAPALGLLPGDEIDGFSVFDDDADGVFGGTDQVIFSLKAGSPSFGVPGGPLFGLPPAAVLSVRFGLPPMLFARPFQIGLLPGDNVDMIEVVRLMDINFDGIPTAAETIQAKIQPTCAADFDRNFTVDLNDLLLLLGHFGCESDFSFACSVDANNDGNTDLNDLLILLAQFGQRCGVD